jgi:hypothetical protein
MGWRVGALMTSPAARSAAKSTSDPSAAATSLYAPDMRGEEIIAGVFALGDYVRYVAVANGQDVELRQRSGLADASSSDSDRYEELLVNPVLLLLARQRGEIDCGGLNYVIVRYGKFAQVVVPNPDGGHVSVAVSPDEDPVRVAGAVRRLLS